MKHNLAALRYAKALINFSENRNVPEKVYKEMKTISKVFSKSKKALNFFNNPIISIKNKKKLIFKILKETSNETIKLIDLLEKNKRLFIIREISIVI